MPNDSRRSPWLLWTAILIGLPVLYALSFGPVCWVTSWFNLNGRGILVMYLPLIWLSEQGRVFNYLFDWYSLLGAAKGWGWEVDPSGDITSWGPV